ncbi:MAG: hypothetical protein EA347_11840 [Thioalkalivibrio sp.]|nr:MAG: hypothetical protein EA347_11840 [Thioalkalivibrio sp.]
MAGRAGDTVNAHERDPVTPPGIASGPGVPWLQIVRYHREILNRQRAALETSPSAEPGTNAIDELLGEYHRLESALGGNPADCGGLRLLEGTAGGGLSADADADQDPARVLAAVTLDDSQRRAVRRALRDSGLTAIEGRPGSGKTEVLLALLLSAWSTGRTVLFVGAGERSAAVAAERFQRLALPVPIAATVATDGHAALADVLRELDRLADAEAGTGAGLPAAGALEAERTSLQQERASLAAWLHSDLYERLLAAARSVLSARAQARKRLAALEREAAGLHAEQQRLGLGALEPEAVEPALTATRRWLDRMADYQRLAREDRQRRAQLDADIRGQEQQRDRVLEEAGLSAGGQQDRDWLVDPDWAMPLEDWRRRFAGLLGEPLEAALEPIAWRREYGRWKSAAEAESWAAGVRALAGSLRQRAGELEQVLERNRDAREAMERHRVKIRGLGLPEDFDPQSDVIPDWLATFRELQGRRPRALDILPWSGCARLRRRMHRLERQLLPLLPPAIHTSVGALDPRGRARLASVLEAAHRWARMLAAQRRIRAETQPQREALEGLSREAERRGLGALPATEDPGTLVGTAADLEAAAAFGEQAAQGWQRREAREGAAEALREIARDWVWLIPRVPLLEVWRHGPGRELDRAVRMLAVQADARSIATARAAIAGGLLSRLRQSRESASNHEHSARRLRAEREAVPGAATRRAEWLEERPPESLLEAAGTGDGDVDGDDDAWPDADDALARLDTVADWCVRWRFLRQEDEPLARQEVETGLNAATGSMEALIRRLPPGPEVSRLLGLLAEVHGDPQGEVPETELLEACSAFGPAGLGARIEAIDREFERRWLPYAQARHLERLRGDAGARRTVSSLLERAGRSRNGTEGAAPIPLEDFRELLRALPVWITDVRGLAELPMAPDLFDLVVIDDAPRGTLTRLLPAIFRGRSLAVAGEARTAPAQADADGAGSRVPRGRFGVEGCPARLTAAGHDLFRVVLESLDRPAEDRLVLGRSHRGHPGIRALSGRLLYPYRPVPRAGSGAPGGSGDDGGVRVLDVPGRAEPGPDGSSWCNLAEVAKVVERVRELRRRAPASSLGVITPFEAQRDRLRAELQDLEPPGSVTIDLPGAFQGGEWDVIVFSPAVARRMTAEARRRLDASPGLFAIALTRAREAFHLVADVEYCLEQDDLLRELAAHCQDLCRLRQDSPDAEGLFTGMLLEGWVPKVQPCIGDIRVDLALEAGPGRQLAIEVDGGESRHDATRARARAAYLECMGYRLLRLEGASLREDPSPAIARIRAGLG